MQHTFDTAKLVLGQGQAARRFDVLDVRISVENAPRGFVPTPGIESPFLNGKIRAEGTLIEECPANKSVLNTGKEAVLKLTTHGQWSLVKILIGERGAIESVRTGVRRYHWSFLVTGRASDSLHLFHVAGQDDDMLDIEDLLDLLGATSDDVGKAEDGTAIKYDTEGGFRLGDEGGDKEGP